jgi:broad specificity phosphatase PhoE
MAKVESKTLLVMRSGETDWDIAGRVQGSVDLPMSGAGEARVRADIAGLGASAGRLTQVFAAPDEASRQTARLLVEATGAKLQVLAELQDMTLGLWEGMLYEDLERRFCRAGRLFLEDPRGITAPEGEALAEYARRLGKTLPGLARKVRMGASAALVLRPIALGLVRCTLNDADMCQMWSMVTDRPTAEWYVLARNDPRLAADPAVKRRAHAAA